jgi:hypothetical protein
MAEKKICIFWSSITFIQPSHYPYLFEELKKMVAVRSDIELIDVSLLEFKEIADKANNCDLIVIDHSIKFCYSILLNATRFNFILRVHNKRNPNFYLEVFDFLFSISNTPKIFILTCDMHALNSSIEGRFDGLGSDVFEKYISKVQGIVWVYRPEEMINVSEVPESYRDPFMIIKDGYFPPRQNAMRIKKTVPTIIELPLCVNEKEVNRRRHLTYWDVSVIGDGYMIRKIAQKKIKEAKGVSLAPYYIVNRVKNKLNDLAYKSKIASADNISRFNFFSSHLIQDSILKRSSMSFTCGSGYMYFVRKFFEIPASGSVLLGYAPEFAKDYGFISEHNYQFSLPEDVVDNIRFLKKNRLIKEKLKSNAFDVIEKLHTTNKRAEQFIYALEQFAKKPYKEARFAGGNYTIFK